jgi:fructose-bisphosphate aldolase class II
MFLTGAQLREVFLKAKRQRFGIMASNVVFDTQIRAIVQGYNAVGSDGLLQMSSGAVKFAAGASQDMNLGAKLISTMIKTYASQFPKSGVGLHIDHATPNYFDFIVFCVENNLVTSVMIDASKENLEDNIRITKEVVDLAHKHGIIVEGEIGHIKGTEDEIVSDTELYTKPEEALEFVKRTNVDLFAASVGTNHGVSKGENIVLRLATAIQAFWEKEKYAIVCPPDMNPADYIPNKSKFDPRKWLIKGEEVMQNTIMDFCRVSGSENNSILL